MSFYFLFFILAQDETQWLDECKLITQPRYKSTIRGRKTPLLSYYFLVWRKICLHLEVNLQFHILSECLMLLPLAESKQLLFQVHSEKLIVCLLVFMCSYLLRDFIRFVMYFHQIHLQDSRWFSYITHPKSEFACVFYVLRDIEYHLFMLTAVFV